jgi:hypothetical protein
MIVAGVIADLVNLMMIMGNAISQKIAKKIKKRVNNMIVNIPETFYWSTYHVHHNNEQTLGEFLYTILPEEYTVTFVDGTYAEIISPDGIEYGVHASGNGDFYNHKIEFEEI